MSDKRKAVSGGECDRDVDANMERVWLETVGKMITKAIDQTALNKGVKK